MIRFLAALAAVALLAGCAGTTPVTPYKVIADANTLVQALQASTQALASQTPPVIDAATAATIQADLAAAQKLTASLSGSMAATDAQPIVQQIEADLNAVVTTLAGMPLPPPYNTYVQAAAVLLPVLEAFANNLTTGPVTVGAAPGHMTQDQALLVLQGSLVR